MKRKQGLREKEYPKLQRLYRWQKAKTPYFKCCLTCTLSCSMMVMHGDVSYDIFSCPKRDRGEPMYPYAYEKMKKEREAMLKAGGKTNGK